jgi:hypothetical protein
MLLVYYIFNETTHPYHRPLEIVRHELIHLIPLSNNSNAGSQSGKMLCILTTNYLHVQYF